jgi:hypothetical protein
MEKCFHRLSLVTHRNTGTELPSRVNKTSQDSRGLESAVNREVQDDHSQDIPRICVEHYNFTPSRAEKPLQNLSIETAGKMFIHMQ